ncbi:MAG: TetR/AcrR family transcriptional regulator [Chloroflexi bacterium]|nr:TetR/AcrR family transcriptional regulator [Chloroflexota bacterium]
MTLPDFDFILPLILDMERQGIVTRRFRRLDPERQQAIVAAIYAEAEAHGVSGINVKAVARRAGIAVGSLYQYFNDRDGLLSFALHLTVQVATGTFRGYRRELAALPLRQALLAYLEGGLEWSRQEASFAAFFARAAYQGDPGLAPSLVRPVADEMRAMVTAILDSARERGELRPDLDHEAAGRLVHAMLIAVADPLLLPYLNDYFQVSGGAVTPERAITAAVDLLLNGIAAPPAAPKE